MNIPAPKPLRTSSGIVLVIALIMLALISLLAALSLRNAISTEAVSAAVRTTELATQAAEIALRHCESLVVLPTAATHEGAATAPPDSPSIRRFPVGSAPLWQDTDAWDSHSAAVVVLPLSAVNQAGTHGTYSRPPECMVEELNIRPAEGSTSSTTVTVTAFVVSARGFGPEVPAQPSRGHPAGTEVWLQSQIEQVSTDSGAPGLRSRAWRQLFMR